MGQFKGSAYVYTVASVHPSSDPADTAFAPFKMKLQPHALAMNDYFGASVSVDHGVLAVGAPGDVDSEVDLWRKQTIYNTSQADGMMKAYEKAYPSSKAGQKTAPVRPHPNPDPGVDPEPEPNPGSSPGPDPGPYPSPHSNANPLSTPIPTPHPPTPNP